MGELEGGRGSSGDLPQRHAVNQSDLGRTGTHLVTAPANTVQGKDVRDLHLIGEGRARRWIDGSGMSRRRWVATGRGMVAGARGVVGATAINGVMWAELKQKGGIDSFLSAGRDENAILAGINILGPIDGRARLMDQRSLMSEDDGACAGVRPRLTARDEDEARISYLHSLIWTRCRP